MATLSKLQIRAKVLSVISEIKSLQNYSEELLNKFVSELSEIEDRNTLFDVFLKEFIKMSEQEYMFSSCIIKQLVGIDYVQEKVFEILKSNAYSDDAKYKLVQLLRSLGSNSAFDAIPQYFDNPEEVLDMETQKLLESAVINPEAMLDFLDFIYAVPQKDKKLLLSSLIEDYSGDVLANIVYPILYADFDDEFKLYVIDILSESKSSLAIAPFKYLSEITENDEIKNACTLALKKLKLSGATEQKALEYYNDIVKALKISKFYTTIPDGNGNQALLISRKSSNDKYIFEAVVINDNLGIIDTFGFFNISKTEFDKIVAKFYSVEGKYQVTPEYVKYRINYALEISKTKKRTLPYEFVCWNILTKDILPLEESLVSLVDSSINYVDVSQDSLVELLTKDYTLRWYIKADENSVLKELLDEIYNAESLDIDYVNNKIYSFENSIFDEKTLSIWKDRLYNLIYLLYVNSKKTEAVMFYALLKNELNLNLFKSILLQRSIFNHFVALKENLKESKSIVNIFKKRNNSTDELDVNKIDSIISFLKKSWLNE